ncbi:MAG: hypothetical protein H7641_14790 [Candidatus Heimdallarchaeota archaeon]|nr:hypothetical protein [Candidatus Heimdallarchaeota archaeon]MCK4878829.1 hypothetical protein [Candidatus Heimdallarchaeota archaeon]
MPYERMARNLNQSIFAFVVGAIFSLLIIVFFSYNQATLTLTILAVPLSFLAALIAVTECVYHYRDEVTLQSTFDMLGSLLKSFLLSILAVVLYSAVILILKETVENFERTLNPLLNSLPAVPFFVTIPVIFLIPVIIELCALPFLLLAYGKIHIAIWGRKSKEEKLEEKEKQAQEFDKEYRSKMFRVIDQLEHQALQLQQYLLELQAVDKQIDSVDAFESYKSLNMRFTMMRDYIESLEIEEEKETKEVMEEADIVKKIREVDIQKKTVLDLVKQKFKKLKAEKGKFEKEEEYYEEEEKRSVEETVVEETVQEEIIEESTKTDELDTTEEEKTE